MCNVGRKTGRKALYERGFSSPNPLEDYNMRKNIGLALASAISLGVAGLGAASAADMAVKARPMVAPPIMVYNWTGCYVGGNVGGARADVRSDGVPNAVFVALNAPGAASVQATSIVKNTPSGFTAGGGVGCNYQTGIFVIGVEGDINYSDLGFSQIRGPFPTNTSTPHTWEEHFRSNWFATARARAGVVVAERSLLYVTGGAAFAEYNTFKALDFPGNVGFRYQGTTSDSKVGWVVGAGWEYAFTGNWSGKIEYLHMDFGNSSVLAFQNTPNSTNGVNHTFNFREDVVRVGLNYRFGSAAVVAKY
jgi:opacity protein-like surface antigen